LEAEARARAADLSIAFRGSLAPVRQLVLESQTPQECVDRISAFYAEWSPAKLAALLEVALAAFAAKALPDHPQN